MLSKFTLPGAKAPPIFIAVVKSNKNMCFKRYKRLLFIFTKHMFFIILAPVVLLTWLTQLACLESRNPLAREPTAGEGQIGGLH